MIYFKITFFSLMFSSYAHVNVYKAEFDDAMFTLDVQIAAYLFDIIASALTLNTHVTDTNSVILKR